MSTGKVFLKFHYFKLKLGESGEKLLNEKFNFTIRAVSDSFHFEHSGSDPYDVMD